MSTLDRQDFTPRPGAAPLARQVLAQASMESRLMLRNGEQLLLAVVIPVIVLIGGVEGARHLDLSLTRRPVDVFAPGVLALAVMSTAFTSLAISTGFERRYGVIKRLGSSPLPRSGLLLGKVGALLLVEALQVVVISSVALVLGWDPDPGYLAALLAIIAGTAAFAALGLFVAGVLRAEATLAAANLVYLLLLAGGAVVLPPSAYGAFGKRHRPAALGCARRRAPRSLLVRRHRLERAARAARVGRRRRGPDGEDVQVGMRSVSRLGDRTWLVRFAWATLLANVGIVLTGGAVRLTGSGLGCPTWPRCTDQSFTPHGALNLHSAIEFGNRTLTFVLTVIAVATFVSAWQSGRRELRRLALLLALSVPAQALLGGVTVLTDLNPWVVAFHLLFSMGIISLAVLYLWRIDTAPPTLVVEERGTSAASARSPGRRTPRGGSSWPSAPW